jgi:predicted MFS family arabinose efflux permease
MARSPRPLVPLHLFRSRNFTMTNLSTFVIYGALYVAFYYIPLFMQGTLGYSASATGLSTIPGTLLLVFLSSRFGTLAGRHGPRWFMAAGPAIMAVGILWLLRVAAASQAWVFVPGRADSYLPPAAYLTDFLPGFVIFGLGLAVMVAPLTTCLMTSVQVAHSGLASAINNAISRVGPQFAGAAIFVAITASFYADLAGRVPGLDPSSPAVRGMVSPLNRPADATPIPVAAAAREASASVFHLAMAISAGLLLTGALINAAGIRNPSSQEATPQVSAAR